MPEQGRCTEYFAVLSAVSEFKPLLASTKIIPSVLFCWYISFKAWIAASSPAFSPTEAWRGPAAFSISS